jgi:hypothetical protein
LFGELLQPLQALLLLLDSLHHLSTVNNMVCGRWLRGRLSSLPSILKRW